jgi:hypothetical protein
MDNNEDKTAGPALGSARGLVLMQPGWDEPMSLDEVEEVFFPCDDEADSPNRQ